MNCAPIAIVNYGLGNLYSIKQALDSLGVQSFITSEPAELDEASALVLPGVGAFGHAMENLRQLRMVNAIRAFVDSGRPLLGICLGMQLLFSTSDEHGQHEGLNLISGHVCRFPDQDNTGRDLRVPHIGWSEIYHPNPAEWSSTPLESLPIYSSVYFVHSFFVVPTTNQFVNSYASYGGIHFCASIINQNIFATQFHPEKSGTIGLKILKSWLFQKLKN